MALRQYTIRSMEIPRASIEATLADKIPQVRRLYTFHNSKKARRVWYDYFGVP